MVFRIKKIRLIFFIYWFLLAYIIAALVWWFIALSLQNDQMAILKISNIKKDDIGYEAGLRKIESEKKRKTAQYIGEGAIFFLLISAGAVFVYRSVNRQLKDSRQQQSFMIAITHELKTPIAVTKLNLETLQKRKLDETQQQRLLHNTLQEANRLNALCNNMLLSSQMEAGGYTMVQEEISFSKIVQNCVSDFKIRFPERDLAADINSEAFIAGDEMLMQMAINNLLDNALKYSPKESKVMITLFKKDTFNMLSIADEGPGIEVLEKKKVFEKFYRTGNDATKHAKGTGLGLYLAKRIVIAHKGEIFISDNHPVGSIFTIQLKQLSAK